MQNDKNQNSPKTADAPQGGELMKCPECGGNSFILEKTVLSDEVQCWRIPDRWGAGIRVEENDPGGYDDLQIICRGCNTTFEESKILKMWNVGGWYN